MTQLKGGDSSCELKLSSDNSPSRRTSKVCMLNSLLSNFFAARSAPRLPAEIPSADDTAVVFSNLQRGQRLFNALARRTGATPPRDGSGVVGHRAGKGALELHTPRQPGNDAPLQGYLLDDRTLALRAPADDPASLSRLVGALMHHGVGLIVDLSTGQARRTGPHGLSSTSEDDTSAGGAADVCRIDVPPAQGLPENAINLELDLTLHPPEQDGQAASRAQRCRIDLVELSAPLEDDVLPVADALKLVRYCQRRRQDFPAERIAYLSVDGHGPALALAGMERLFENWSDHRLRPADVEQVVLDHAIDLTKRCGAFSLLPPELATMADFAEYLAANPLGSDPHDQSSSAP